MCITENVESVKKNERGRENKISPHSNHLEAIATTTLLDFQSLLLYIFNIHEKLLHL